MRAITTDPRPTTTKNRGQRESRYRRWRRETMKSEAQKAAQRRYNASPKGRASRDRYAATEAGRAAQKKSKAAWNAANAEAVRAASRARFAVLTDRVNSIKTATGCADCGFSGHPAALDFDHISGEKVANVSRLIRLRPWADIEAEIAKCEVVCANCHRIRTFERMK